MNKWIDLILLSLFCLFSLGCSAQKKVTIPIKEYNYGRKGTDNLNDMVESFDGGLWALGESESIEGAGMDGWLLKISAEGSVTKRRKIEGKGDFSGTAVIEDQLGRLLVGGNAKLKGNRSPIKYKSWLKCFSPDGIELWDLDLVENSREVKLGGIAYDENKENYLITGVIEKKVWVSIVNMEGKEISKIEIGSEILTDLVPLSAQIQLISDHYYIYTTLQAARGGGKIPGIIKMDRTGTIVNQISFSEQKIKETGRLIGVGDKLVLIGTGEGERADIFYLTINQDLRTSSIQAAIIKDRFYDEGADIAYIKPGLLYMTGSTNSHLRGANTNNFAIYQLNEKGELLTDKPNYFGDKLEERGRKLVLKKDGSLWMGGTKDVGNTFFSNLDFYFAKIATFNTGVKENLNYSALTLNNSVSTSTKNAPLKLTENKNGAIEVVITNKTNNPFPNLVLEIECTNCADGLESYALINLEPIQPKKDKIIKIPIWTTSPLEEKSNIFNIRLKNRVGKIIRKLDKKVYTAKRTSFKLKSHQFKSERSDKIVQSSLMEMTIDFENTDEIDLEEVTAFFKLPEDVFYVDKAEYQVPFVAKGRTVTFNFPFRLSSNYSKDYLVIEGFLQSKNTKNFYDFSIKGKIEKETVRIDLNNPGAKNKKKLELEWKSGIITNKVVNTSRKSYEIAILVNHTIDISKEHFTVLVKNEKSGKTKRISNNNAQFARAFSLVENPIRPTYLYVETELESGVNQIEVEYRDGSIYAKTTTPHKVNYESTAKSTLYVLSVGVAYPTNNQEIGSVVQYTANDAKDFASLFGKQGGQLKEKVKISLLNEPKNTNALAIASSINNLQESSKKGQITSNDLVVLFLSGYGLMDDREEDFLIMGSDYNPENKKFTSINFREDIVEKLSTLNCPVLVFMDTYKNGFINQAILDRMGKKGISLADFSNAEQINKNIFKASPFETLVSCSNKQFAYEDSAWQNGAFTTSIVRILGDKSRCKQLDKNRDGLLSLMELQQDLENEINALVKNKKKGTQTPELKIPKGNGQPFFKY